MEKAASADEEEVYNESEGAERTVPSGPENCLLELINDGTFLCIADIFASIEANMATNLASLPEQAPAAAQVGAIRSEYAQGAEIISTLIKIKDVNSFIENNELAKVKYLMDNIVGAIDKKNLLQAARAADIDNNIPYILFILLQKDKTLGTILQKYDSFVSVFEAFDEVVEVDRRMMQSSSADTSEGSTSAAIDTTAEVVKADKRQKDVERVVGEVFDITVFVMTVAVRSLVIMLSDESLKIVTKAMDVLFYSKNVNLFKREEWTLLDNIKRDY